MKWSIDIRAAWSMKSGQMGPKFNTDLAICMILVLLALVGYGFFQLTTFSEPLIDKVVAWHSQAKKKVFLEKGKQYLEWRDYQAALIELNNAIQLDPEYAEAYFYKGETYLGMQRYNLAFDAVNYSIQLDSELVEAQLVLGNIYLLSDQFKPAQEISQRLIKKNPQAPEGYLLQARIDLGQQLYSEALEAIEAGKEHNPNHQDLLLTLARIHFLKGDVVQAEKVLLAMVAQQDTVVQPYLALSSFYRATDDSRKAEQILLDAVSHSDSSYTTLIGLGLYYQAANKPAAAEQTYTTAARLYPDNGWVQFILGEYYSTYCKYEAAIAAYEQALAAEPRFLLPKMRLAHSYLEQNQLTKSDSLAQQILASVPTDVYGLYLKGKILFFQEDYKGALVMLEKALSKSKNYYKGTLVTQEKIRSLNRQFSLSTPDDLHYIMGMSYHQNERVFETLNTFQLVDLDSPAYHASKRLLAEAYYKMKMFDKAIELSRQLLQEDPENLVVSVLLGKALMASGFPGHIEEGLALTFEWLPQAIASDPDNAQLYIDLGQALDKAQQLTATATNVQQTVDDSNRSTVLPYSLPFRQADQAYRAALALDPQNTQVFLLMGQYYASQNQADSTVVYYQRILDNDPEQRATQKQLAYQFLRQKRFRESALLAEKILRQQLMDTDGLYLKGRVELALGDYRAALKTLKRLDRDNHSYTFPTAQFEWPFHYYLGLAHYRNNEFVKTRDILQQLPSPWNTQPKIVILQAETMAHLGNPLGAIAILRNVLRADPKNLQAAIALGHCQVSAGRWQDAFETFAEILVKDRDNTQALYGQGLVYAGQNRIPEALDVFEGVILQDADFIEPLEYLIQFDIQNGQVEKAIERCARQAERSSQNMTLQLMLANLLLDHKQIDAALEQVTKALSIDPKAVEAHTLLGVLYEKKGESNQAKSSYKAALSFDPRHVQATNSLALLYGAEDAYSKAAWHYNAMAAELSPEDAQVLGRLGGISYKQGNLNSAIMALEKSIRLNSGEPLFHYHLGMAHYKQENFKEARYALEKSLALDANHASADTAWMALKKMDESPTASLSDSL